MFVRIHYLAWAVGFILVSSFVAGCNALEGGQQPTESNSAAVNPHLHELTFHAIPTTRDAIAALPFLPAIQADIAKLPKASHGPERIIEFATVEKAIDAPAADLIIVRVEDSISCGIAGCATFVYERTSNIASKKLFDVIASPVGATYLLKCPKETALLFPPGGGMNEGWGKWTFDGTSFRHQRNSSDLSGLAMCD